MVELTFVRLVLIESEEGSLIPRADSVPGRVVSRNKPHVTFSTRPSGPRCLFPELHSLPHVQVPIQKHADCPFNNHDAVMPFQLRMGGICLF